MIDLVKPDLKLTCTLLECGMEQYMVIDEYYKLTT